MKMITARLSQKPFSIDRLCIFGYLLPLLTLSAVSQGLEAEGIYGYLIRALCIAPFLGIMSLLYLQESMSEKKALSPMGVKFLACAGVTATLPLILSLVKGGSFLSHGHGFLQGWHILVFMVFIPALFKTNRITICVNSFARTGIQIACAIICIALIYHIFNASQNTRLVSPINPKMIASCAWILAFFYLGWHKLAFVLSLMIIWTGSRIALLLIAMCYAWHLWTVFKTRGAGTMIGKGVKTLAALLLCLVLISLVIPDKSPLHRYTVQGMLIMSTIDQTHCNPARAGKCSPQRLLSNRDQRMSSLLKKIWTLDIMLKGATGSTDEIRGSHNSFIKLTAMYGGIFAVFCYVLWFALFIPALYTARIAAAWMIFGGLSVYSIFFSTFYTNMSDFGTGFALLWLLAATFGRDARKDITQV